MSTRLQSNQQPKPTFPVDEYTPANIISYQIADLPPGKFATNNEPVPSVRYLFSDGVDTRKWTRWLRISYNEKAALTKLFCGFNNPAALMESDEADGALWNTPMLIFCEKNGEKYTNIAKVKPAEKRPGESDFDGINPDEAFYSAEFTPYKTVRAYGHLVPLRLAVLKVKGSDGKPQIKVMQPDDMIEAPDENDNN